MKSTTVFQKQFFHGFLMVLFHKIFVDSKIIIKKFIHTLLFVYFVYIILKANILLSALLA